MIGLCLIFLSLIFFFLLLTLSALSLVFFFCACNPCILTFFMPGMILQYIYYMFDTPQPSITHLLDVREMHPPQCPLFAGAVLVACLPNDLTLGAGDHDSPRCPSTDLPLPPQTCLDTSPCSQLTWHSPRQVTRNNVCHTYDKLLGNRLHKAM